MLPAELPFFANGYLEAADIIVDHLAHQHRNDSLVFPIIFCYRQYVELKLKEISSLYNVLDYGKDHHSKIHSLEGLWQTLKPRLEVDLGAEDQETLMTVGKLVSEFHDFDPNAIALRYPEETYLVKVPMQQVDLENLRDVMARLAMYLGSAVDFIEAMVKNSNTNAYHGT